MAELPLVMVTGKVDGEEVLRRAIYASTVQELEESIRNVYPDGTSLILERVLVFDARFNDYLDADDQTTRNLDKFLLEFSMPSHSSQPPGVQKPNSSRLQQASLHFVGGNLVVGSGPPVDAGFPEDESSTEDEIRQRSCIFGKGGSNLNRYQACINEAAFKLALDDPTLLNDRGELLKRSRKSLHLMGYTYAHGNKTRSKTLGKKLAGTSPNKPFYETAGEGRLDELERNIKNLKTQLEYIEKGTEKAVAGKFREQAVAFEQLAQDLNMKLQKLVIEKSEISKKSIKLQKRKKSWVVHAYKKRQRHKSSDKMEVGLNLVVSSEPPVNTGFHEDKSSVEDEIRQRSCIFGKGGSKLNRYQVCINEAAFKLALDDPTLLNNRGELLKRSRKSLHLTGYTYAHGNKTRSKTLGQNLSEISEKSIKLQKRKNSRVAQAYKKCQRHKSSDKMEDPNSREYDDHTTCSPEGGPVGTSATSAVENNITLIAERIPSVQCYEEVVEPISSSSIEYRDEQGEKVMIPCTVTTPENQLCH